MAALNLVQSSFLAGALRSSLQGRIDAPLYDASVRLARNFDVTPQGTLRKRGGFRYAWSQAAESNSELIVPFILGDGRTLALLASDTKLQAFLDGAPVEGSGGTTPAEVDTSNWTVNTDANPHSNIRWSQVGDSIYLVRPTKPLAKLTLAMSGVRLSMEWEEVSFVTPPQTPPVPPENLELIVSDAQNSRFIEIDPDSDDSEASASIAGNWPMAIYSMASWRGKALFFAANTRNIYLVNEDRVSRSLFANIPPSVSVDPIPTLAMAVHGDALYLAIPGSINPDVHRFELANIAANEQSAELRVASRTLRHFGSAIFPDMDFAGFTSREGRLYLLGWDGVNHTGKVVSWSDEDFKNTRLNPWYRIETSWDQTTNSPRSLFSYGERLFFIGTGEQLVEFGTDWSRSNGRLLSGLSNNINAACVLGEARSLLTDSSGFSSVAFFQGRLALAGHPAAPNTLYLSDSNAFNSFTEGTEDDDSLRLEITAGPDSGIHWMLPWQDRLVLGTSQGIYQLAAPGGVVTPTNFQVLYTSATGSSKRVPAIPAERGLLFVDADSTGVFHYRYREDSDLFMARPISNGLRGLEGRRIDRLQYAHTATPVLVIEATKPQDPPARDRRDILRALLDETAPHIAGTEYVLPAHWTDLKTTLLTDRGLWVLVSGKPSGAPAGRHSSVLLFQDFDNPVALDASIIAESGSSFTTISSGLSFLGEGSPASVRAGGKDYLDSPVGASGGLSFTLDPAVTKAEAGVPFSAVAATQSLRLKRPDGSDSFGQTGRISRARALVAEPRRVREDGYSEVAAVLRARPTSVPDSGFVNGVVHRNPGGYYQDELTPRWLEFGVSSTYDEDPSLVVTTVGLTPVEILALVLRFETGNN